MTLVWLNRHAEGAASLVGIHWFCLVYLDCDMVALEESQNEDKNKGSLILLYTENQDVWLFTPINN